MLLKKIKLKWVVCLISFISFLILTYLVINNKVIKIDSACYECLFTLFSKFNLTFFLKVITNLAGPIILIFLSISSFLLTKNKKVSLCICLNLILCSLLNYGLKNIISRPRPDVLRLVFENGYSFPSGHAMASLAFYGFLIFLIYKYFDKKNIKIILISLLSILIILIGLSRIYLGVHYLSDVLAGFFLALSYLIIFISVVNKKIIE